MLRRLTLLVLTPLFMSNPALAAPNVLISGCMSDTTGQLTCDLRAVVPAPLGMLEHLNDGFSESVTLDQFEGTAAWSMVVDTTHELPVGLITDDRYDGIRADLADMIELSSDRRMIEVHAFDGTLRTLAAFGDDQQDALNALDELGANSVDPQDRSGLFLSAITAIDRLAELEADRKALVLFTDGLSGASDASIDRLITAANAADVSIIGMAYASGEAHLANHLELRVMADQTAGTTLYPSMTNQRLSDDNMRGFFATLENGGTVQLSSDMAQAEDVLVRATYLDGRIIYETLSVAAQ